MLDREDDAALAEIEAALRRDDPAFVLLIERLEHDPLGVPGATRIGETRHGAGDGEAAELSAGWNPGQPGPDDDQPPSPRFDRRFDDPVGPSRRPGSAPAPLPAAAVPIPSVARVAPAHRTGRARLSQWVGLLLAVTGAMALTVLVTALAGPDLGGLVGVVSITAATFVGYRRMVGCPVRRSRP